MTKQTLSINVVSHGFEDLDPDCTYFRTSEVRPFIQDNQLHIYEGNGNRRSWGTPNVSTEVTQISPDVIQAYVVGWHKHTVSPVGGNYYFVNENNTWTRRRANARRIKEVLAQ